LYFYQNVLIFNNVIVKMGFGSGFNRGDIGSEHKKTPPASLSLTLVLRRASIQAGKKNPP
jgi:hypothetical protein